MVLQLLYALCLGVCLASGKRDAGKQYTSHHDQGEINTATSLQSLSNTGPRMVLENQTSYPSSGAARLFADLAHTLRRESDTIVQGTVKKPRLVGRTTGGLLAASGISILPPPFAEQSHVGENKPNMRLAIDLLSDSGMAVSHMLAHSDDAQDSQTSQHFPFDYDLHRSQTKQRSGTDNIRKESEKGSSVPLPSGDIVNSTFHQSAPAKEPVFLGRSASKASVILFPDVEIVPGPLIDTNTLLDATKICRAPKPAAFPSLSRAAALRMVNDLLPSNDALRYGITGEAVCDETRQLLNGSTTWLSGDLIDAYMALLQERSTAAELREIFVLTRYTKDLNICLADTEYIDSHIVSAMGMDDIRKYRRVFLPFNVADCHWVLVVVDIEQRTIILYDSLIPEIRNAMIHNRQLLATEQKRVMDSAKSLLSKVHAWVVGEMRFARALDTCNKQHSDLDRERRYFKWIERRLAVQRAALFRHNDDIKSYFPEWVTAAHDPDRRRWFIGVASDAPQQLNDIDCGVFTLKVAEAISQSIPLVEVRQDEMHVHRSEIYEAVMVGRLADDSGELRPIYKHHPKRRIVRDSK